MSRLQEHINSGNFVITAEIGPPKGTDVSKVVNKLKFYDKEKIVSVNITDNQRAVMKMSPIATSCIVKEQGYEPILQLTCRDRNRISLQSELLGASALGIKNILALTGDHISAGDHKDAKPVFDLDSVTLIRAIHTLNSGYDMSGNKLAGKTDFFVGGVINPCSANMELQLLRLEKKVKAGLQFVQTQAVYDLDVYREFYNEASKNNIAVLAGILLLKSAKMARFLNAKVPGVKVPDSLIDILDNSADPVKEGIEIAKDIILSIKEFGHGVHLMSIAQEKEIGELVREINI